MAEGLGTFLLIFFGLGAVHVSVLTGALVGLWQVAIVWALGVTLAIYTVAGISGAHINPAITLTLAVLGRFRWRDVPGYLLAQIVGAMLAATILLVLYGPFLADKERAKQVLRGQAGSEITAMCYGEYFPSPGGLASGTEPYSRAEHERHNALVCEPVAFLAEVIGTLILALVVLAVTDERNRSWPGPLLAPAFIGLTVAALIMVIAPLTQACFNPARDFGPRLVAWLAGWGSMALPGPRGLGFLTVYIVAPILGALLGGALYSFLLRPAYPASAENS